MDFFKRTVEVFQVRTPFPPIPLHKLTGKQTLDTYTALATAGITPDNDTTYTLAEIQAALNNVTGYEAVVGCQGNRLNQAWYSFNVKGSLQSGDFVPVDPAGKGLRCPERGIVYLPK